MKPGSLLILAAAAAIGACGTRADPPAPQPIGAPDRTAAVATTHAPAGSPGPAAAPEPVKVAEGAPLPDGRVAFEGMVTPTKGGFQVRGVTLDGGEFPRVLAASKPDHPRDDPDWVLGAVVRVTAEVRRHDDGPPVDGGIAIQRRSGPHVRLVRLEAVELVKPAMVIEGKLQRSKGLMQLGEHMVTRQDLSWALGREEVEDGDRVRLWGQPRVYRCAPGEQCLMEGSIPMFDVGRAQRLP